MSNPYIVYMAPVRPPGWKPVRPAWENTEAPKPPESKPFKRSKSVVNGMRRREEGETRKLVYEIMCVASEIRHLSEKLRK